MTNNKAFKDIKIKGENGNYVVSGTVCVYEGVFNYRIEDGHNILSEGIIEVREGGPNWVYFEHEIKIPADRLPKHGVFILELFEVSMENNNEINNEVIVLEDFNKKEMLGK